MLHDRWLWDRSAEQCNSMGSAKRQCTPHTPNFRTQRNKISPHIIHYPPPNVTNAMGTGMSNERQIIKQALMH